MKVERLTVELKEEAVEVLADAFHDYAVMRFVLKTSGEEYERQLRELVGFFCNARYCRDGYVLGIREGHEWIAVSLVDPAVSKPWPEKDLQLAQLREKIGDSAYTRLELYEEISSRLEPPEPHFFIGMIGVRTKHQGKGFSRMLMESAKALSDQDPNSAGVCLSTENPGNVPYYQHFGYKIIGEADIQELHSWCLFKTARTPGTPGNFTNS